MAASRARAAALAAVLGVMSAAAGVQPASAVEPMRPTLERAWVAQVVVPTKMRARPGGRVRGRIGTTARWGGGPVKLLVLASATDRRGGRWLRVRLPTRPNDASAWLPTDRLRVSRTSWRVHVSTARRTVTVLRAGRVVRRFRAVVGTPATPTPSGLFAVSERIRQRGGVLGPWALHLTAHSNVLFNFGGGLGRVAIHGRSGSLLADPLGSAASHGCIRISNRPVSWLASRAREGTPVLVR